MTAVIMSSTYEYKTPSLVLTRYLPSHAFIVGTMTSRLHKYIFIYTLCPKKNVVHQTPGDKFVNY